MRVWNSLDEVPTDLPRTVVTLGNFDGVHRGHREVLRRVVELARARDALAVAVTLTTFGTTTFGEFLPRAGEAGEGALTWLGLLLLLAAPGDATGTWRTPRGDFSSSWIVWGQRAAFFSCRLPLR